jgi:hypothetical protein
LPEPEPDRETVRVWLTKNFSIRLLSRSAAYTLPEPSLAVAAGLLSCPAPEPAIPVWQELVQISKPAAPSLTPNPQASVKAPDGENSSIRLFRVSATYTSPASSVLRSSA